MNKTTPTHRLINMLRLANVTRKAGVSVGRYRALLPISQNYQNGNHFSVIIPPRQVHSTYSTTSQTHNSNTDTDSNNNRNKNQNNSDSSSNKNSDQRWHKYNKYFGFDGPGHHTVFFFSFVSGGIMGFAAGVKNFIDESDSNYSFHYEPNFLNEVGYATRSVTMGTFCGSLIGSIVGLSYPIWIAFTPIAVTGAVIGGSHYLYTANCSDNNLVITMSLEKIMNNNI